MSSSGERPGGERPPPLMVGVDARSLLCREPRGEGKSLLRLYSEILRIDPQIQVTFFGDEHEREFSGELPSGVRRIGKGVRGHRWETWENAWLPWQLWRSGCQVLHSASSGAPAWAPVPVLMTVHDVIPLVFDDGHTLELRRLFARRLERGLRASRHIVAVSAHTRSDLLRLYPDIRQTVEVIHWGADEPAGDVACRDARNAEAPYVFAFGGEGRRKNTDWLVARWIAVARRVPSLRLQLVGISNPSQREHVMHAAAAAGLSGRLELPGFIGEHELSRRIRDACCVVYPSLYEGFGLPLVEAIGLGTPVLASDRSSIPEILGEAPGAVPLEPVDRYEQALIALCTNPEVRADWLQRQRRILHRLSWRQTASRTLDVLRACTTRPGRSSAEGSGER